MESCTLFEGTSSSGTGDEVFAAFALLRLVERLPKYRIKRVLRDLLSILSVDIVKASGDFYCAIADSKVID